MTSSSLPHTTISVWAPYLFLFYFSSAFWMFTLFPYRSQCTSIIPVLQECFFFKPLQTAILLKSLPLVFLVTSLLFAFVFLFWPCCSSFACAELSHSSCTQHEGDTSEEKHVVVCACVCVWEWGVMEHQPTISQSNHFWRGHFSIYMWYPVLDQVK